MVTAATGAGITFAVNDHNNKPVADAVVSLVPLDEPAPAAPPAGMVEVEQKGQEFLPYVTAVRAGTTVKFPNRDTIEHHVYSQSAARKFELPLYKPGRAETLVFDRPGIVAIGCNIHDWMLAYVVVLPTPWFAITPASGTAKLSNMPAGRFRAEVWHPRLGKTETREVTLSAAATDTPLSFKLTLKPDRRIRRLPDAAGQGYR